jgi:hypothetical protein
LGRAVGSTQTAGIAGGPSNSQILVGEKHLFLLLIPGVSPDHLIDKIGQQDQLVRLGGASLTPRS